MRLSSMKWVSAFTLAALFTAGCERPPVEPVQRGYRGTAMGAVYNPRLVEKQAAQNVLPAPLADAPAAGPPVATIYKNVQVLGGLTAPEFTRTMLAITAWVAPKEGCAYCHNVQNMADDGLYTKVVARKMLQMTQAINSQWKDHVQATGVTCYTCHRGNNIPANVWFTDVDNTAKASLGNRAGQNRSTAVINGASLPSDPFTPFLLKAESIGVNGPTALPTGNRHSVKQTEWTFSLMTHMSQGLGVNCTYCHNSRQFADWSQSPPQRVTAWYGIRMARALNNEYMVPLTDVFPAHRKGPLGDVAKTNCATCHQGAYKPLYGQSMLKDYPVFAAPIPVPAVAVPEAAPDAAPADGAAPPASNVSLPVPYASASETRAIPG